MSILQEKILHTVVQASPKLDSGPHTITHREKLTVKNRNTVELAMLLGLTSRQDLC